MFANKSTPLTIPRHAFDTSKTNADGGNPSTGGQGRRRRLSAITGYRAIDQATNLIKLIPAFRIRRSSHEPQHRSASSRLPKRRSRIRSSTQDDQRAGEGAVQRPQTLLQFLGRHHRRPAIQPQQMSGRYPIPHCLPFLACNFSVSMAIIRTGRRTSRFEYRNIGASESLLIATIVSLVCMSVNAGQHRNPNSDVQLRRYRLARQANLPRIWRPTTVNCLRLAPTAPPRHQPASKPRQHSRHA